MRTWTCQNPKCAREFTQANKGRPAKYCSPRCYQAFRRVRAPESVQAIEYKASQKKYAERHARNNTYKLAKGCADCGDRWKLIAGETPYALQFDHVIPLKTSDKKIRPNWNIMSDVAFQAEVALCEVRCAICHAVKSAAQFKEIMADRWAEVPQREPITSES